MTDASRTRYATIWRWHFYAGLFVAPFLVVLSITGLIYLFNTEINDALYPELAFARSAVPLLPPSRWATTAEHAYPGAQVTRIDSPTEPGRSAQLFVTTAGGEAIRVFVAPGTADVLGDYVYTRTLVGFADVAHGSLMLGDTGDAIVELAACWAFILVVSGLYLWFPRPGRTGGVWLPRLRLRGRNFWRDLHRIGGVYTAVLILFLIVSGLPWATLWGGKVLTPLSNAIGAGYPDGTRRALQSGGVTVAEAVGEAPWTLHHAPMPASTPAACGEPPCAAAPPIGIGAAAAVLASQGMRDPYRLSTPRGPTGVYMAYTYPDRPEGQRTIQIDQYSGAVLADIAFADYGGIAKAVEWGVALHMGNYFGWANQALMALPCIGILALVGTGITMWWKRRPRGRLAAPPRPEKRGIGRGVVATAIVLGIVFPLAGLSMVTVWIGDRAFTTLRRRA
ncbi:MAG: peptidase M4 [Rhodospirillaceae bacterium]|nr:peptidase M4 [Rhodospirillaceae bacterium]